MFKRQVTSTQEILQEETLNYTAPLRLCERTNIADVITKQTFPIVFSKAPIVENCFICKFPLDSEVVRIKSCLHIFHKSCFEGLVKIEPRCPCCSKPVGPPPEIKVTGKMIMNSKEDMCPGFGIWTKTIKIDYSFCGESISLNRMSFLPKNEEGFKLLRRLEYAWLHGMLFSVQKLHSSELSLYSPIPQKSALHGGGIRGFPDTKYLQQCHEILTSQGVPLTMPKEKVIFPKTLCYTSSLRNPASNLTNHAEDLNIIPIAASAPMWYLDHCLLCSETLFEAPCVQINSCGHYFHQSCLEKTLHRELKCPECRTNISEPQGKGPSGSMTIKTISDICPGYQSQTIQITYRIPAGAQLEYHDNPGEPYPSTQRIAYIPNTEEGRALLLRLKYAWNHGMIFIIGTSLTTRKANAVTWSTIEHKTSLHGGPYGFPDADYVEKCNNTLHKLRVPDTKALR